MNVFKFGGASLKDAPSIRNMAAILVEHPHTPLLIVVSAMDKTTNALEAVLVKSRLNRAYTEELNRVKFFHLKLIEELFIHPKEVLNLVEAEFSRLETNLKIEDEDKRYDQVVSSGEIISSFIAQGYLVQCGIQTVWADARNLIRTDSTFREGLVDWENTTQNIQNFSAKHPHKIILTQGFIGGDKQGNTTTLGREGSDFSAAIFASCLEAKSVTIWKDVPGVMNADPKRLPAALVFDELPYKEAAEMTYYGASVIHPKTIKPLALKDIPLYVKSFIEPKLSGTKIHECKIDHLPPMIVFKDNQCLVSCKVTDYTFINEQQLSVIFHALTELNIKLNLMQNSAISFSFCIDFIETKLNALIEKLHQHFEVYYNTNLTLITIKNCNEQSFETYRKKPGILMEQSSRSTLQVLLKNE